MQDRADDGKKDAWQDGCFSGWLQYMYTELISAEFSEYSSSVQTWSQLSPLSQLFVKPILPRHFPISNILSSKIDTTDWEFAGKI